MLHFYQTVLLDDIVLAFVRCNNIAEDGGNRTHGCRELVICNSNFVVNEFCCLYLKIHNYASLSERMDSNKGCHHQQKSTLIPSFQFF